MAGEKIYLFLISQGELVWYGEWLESTSQESFDASIAEFLAQMDTGATQQHLLEANEAIQKLLFKAQVDVHEQTGEQDPIVKLIDFAKRRDTT